MCPSRPTGALPQVRSGRETLAVLADPLDDLHAATATPVTARRIWLDCWAEAFPRYEPWLVVVPSRGPRDELAAAAPLARVRTAGVTTIVGMGHGTSDHMRLAARDDAAAVALVDAIAAALRDLPGPWRLVVEQLPADDPVASRLARRLEHAQLDAQEGAGIPLQHLTPNVEADDLLSRSERKDRRRRRRRLEELGSVEIAFTAERDEIARLLPELATIRTRRDHQQGRVSALDATAGRSFWETVILRLADRGEIEVATMRCGGVVISYAVSLLDGDVCRLWDGRFDPRWSRYGPGALVDQAALQRAVSRGFRVLDLMRGETDEKLRHASAVLPTFALRAWSSAPLRATDLAVARAKGWAKTRKDASPTLYRAWRRVKAATVLRRLDG